MIISAKRDYYQYFINMLLYTATGTSTSPYSLSKLVNGG